MPIISARPGDGALYSAARCLDHRVNIHGCIIPSQALRGPNRDLHDDTSSHTMKYANNVNQSR